MSTNRVLASSRLRLVVIVLVAAVGVIASQEKSAPHSHFVLSSPDARLAVLQVHNYALSVEKLDVPPEASGAMVTSTAKENVLGKAVFVARYGR